MITYIEIMQFLTHQGFAFCNHDKSRYSFNRGNFLEIITLLNQHFANYHCVCLNCDSIIIVGPTVLPPGAINNGRTTTMSLASARCRRAQPLTCSSRLDKLPNVRHRNSIAHILPSPCFHFSHEGAGVLVFVHQ